ncbi:MAG TPA: hypothetical protein VKQ32_05680, partial [Polyangia bacterium]|nr:hypothetical protein [Polyangia bacterium]
PMPTRATHIIGFSRALGLALALAAFVPARAMAQAAPAPARTPPAPPAAAAPAAQPAAEAAPKVKVERGAGGKKVYRITEEFKIEGKIQKPEAFFFYQKSTINYDWQELKQDFIPKILDSVSHSPF